MKVLIIDNYDSFTYNIAHSVKKLGYQVEVHRNDKISVEDVQKYDKIILSSGPGLPSGSSGMMLEIIKTYATTKPILGICFSYLAIAEVFGATIKRASEISHGLVANIELLSDEAIFKDMKKKQKVAYYHSWVVDKNSLSDKLKVIALDEKGEIAAIRHQEYQIYALLFHPESILTPEGEKMILNFLEN